MGREMPEFVEGGTECHHAMIEFRVCRVLYVLSHKIAIGNLVAGFVFREGEHILDAFQVRDFVIGNVRIGCHI